MLPSVLKEAIYTYLDERGLIRDVTLSSFCPNPITALDLRENCNISDVGLWCFSSLCLENLTELYINECYKISDLGLSFIAKKSPMLRTVSLSGCNHVTHETLKFMKYYCPQLREVDLSDCQGIDDRALRLLLGMSVSVINLAECRKIKFEFEGFDSLPVAHSLKSLCLRSIPSVSDYTLGLLLQCTPKLKILDLSLCTGITNRTLHTISNSDIKSTISSLNFWGASSITDRGIGILTDTCTQLQSLTLCDCPQITECTIVQCIAKLKQLTTLNLWSCTAISAVSYQLLLRYVTSFKSLGLCHLPGLQDYSLVGLEKCTSLRSLELDSCVQITGEGVHKLGSESITSINFRRCTLIDANAIFSVMSRSPHLISLNLASCRQVSEDDITRLISLCPHLRNLNLSDCNVTSRVLILIAESFTTQLVTLKIDKCLEFEDSSLNYAIMQLTNLSELSTMFCTQLSNRAFLPTEQKKQILPRNVSESNYVISSRPNMLLHLKTLQLSCCVGLSENSVISVLKRTPRLTFLSIPALLAITDLTLISIGKYVPRLQHLNLAFCTGVSSFGVSRLLKCCKNLKFLDISGIERMDDSILEEISQNCGTLKSLDVSKSFFFKEESVVKLITCLRNLNTLGIQVRMEEQTYSEEFFSHLKNIRPDLNIIGKR
eukprot:TRINITY_DN9184_c0_g1_i2.p1 TRINITY_DN9184_c0_g1~~TRINITY_DN9184_c0_g1_i2.p1  ORF type:complete len:718 (+),score=93.97 TRINITY_DN9184_c0_g1_i2:172-2154(+)